jgi:cation diffusion facilitator CzcD-associated flavoprotein CzcO/acetyl esterase/lipase
MAVTSVNETSVNETAVNETAVNETADSKLDAIVVGAGFAGMYMLHRLRSAGFDTLVIETAEDVGGTWYWNRYPGARCDIESIDYSYSFDPEIEQQWVWSEKYATQPEILRYAQHVADKLDLRRDIQFATKVVAAVWDEATSLWRISTDRGQELSCRYYIMASGCLSVPKELDIEGVERYRGETYFTSRWPHEGVDFTGKRVAVIGTGSSGIQSIPLIAEQTSTLTVFQRTPNFSIPAANGPHRAEQLAAYKAGRKEYRQETRMTAAGMAGPVPEVSALAISEQERNAIFEESWGTKGLTFAGVFTDILTNPEANATLADFVRDKIRSIVADPDTAATLCPTSYPIGTKRLCLDTNYYATYNRPNVRLVDLRKQPLATITETGVDVDGESLTFDAIIFATGFDAMTGAIAAVDITGRDGLTLKDKWAEGPKTYLGLMVKGFPNFFTITGPGSPSVLSNMLTAIEQHVEWITDCVERMRKEGDLVVEPTELAEERWVQHVREFADLTLLPLANSWYVGANIPGKPRVVMPYIGGVGRYRSICDRVVARDYLGFRFEGSKGMRVNDGIIWPLQADVGVMLEIMADMGVPALETLSVEEARGFVEQSGAASPPGPAVGEVIDGTYPGAAGDLAYRLYRPESPGPHPIVVYFHGGGWVLGNHYSDDPICRDLCKQSDCIVISANYRHAPEDRFPAAPEDGFAAIRWVAHNAETLGGLPGRLAVAGWSAGANVAAVVSQVARDAGGPAIAGQLLINPVTDSDFSRASYIDNADGYFLSASLMRWFWDHYADPDDRSDPKASPIRATSLSDLPPAAIFTSEFDPLRDEGEAYAAALEKAGVPVEYVPGPGQIHTSLVATGGIVSAAGARSEMAAALRRFVGR